VGERIDENSDLITWDKAEELAVPTQNNDQIEPLNHQPNQIQPIEEIQD
jgi:hypothetical protein